MAPLAQNREQITKLHRPVAVNVGSAGHLGRRQNRPTSTAHRQILALVVALHFHTFDGAIRPRSQDDRFWIFPTTVIRGAVSDNHGIAWQSTRCHHGGRHGLRHHRVRFGLAIQIEADVTQGRGDQ